jgi:hypothetical protein
MESNEIRDDWVYVVTDIEVDGPWPGANSMRSFASVAVTANGEEYGTAAVTGWPVAEIFPRTLPSDWLGHIEHTQRADDARGYAHLVGVLFRRANSLNHAAPGLGSLHAPTPSARAARPQVTRVQA